jgi:hypothetical protein
MSGGVGDLTDGVFGVFSLSTVIKSQRTFLFELRFFKKALDLTGTFFGIEPRDCWSGVSSGVCCWGEDPGLV